MSQLRWMPGDRRESTKAMVRVDQAGEYGATRIYAGQLAVLGDRHPFSRAIHHMAEQEERHRAFFDRLIAERRVRPTLFQPFWDKAGFALGAITAAISPKAAMACTAAVETEIDKHYQQQLEQLGDSDPELSEAIADFQAEELEHRDHALGAGAQEAFAYPVLYGLIRAGCKVAIAAAKRI
ncbi:MULTISPECIES: demethoxyubiquinone hydroxylase family protein [Sphingomonas]|jgi:3-demethoxyubiquinol 3-hydroxylase|uniref:3-demethoxyubiquinol 3-hydroxylase n=1 Tax=Sphingomonas zeae TaxID=1646122 RepID=A0A7Y6EHE8_9SPHN|nr:MULTISPECIES: demethoxyubiquinone hydroxylase family protein [Sphingomonas]MBB4048064.1 ubiquinone biosynthesis monooxygenase Coq7 [Sphingomonas zeae]MDK8184856.1 demethoxyubiquinone hydroxylase family protein [Sphingomonas zeae]MDK8215577.1 demethoxyubiquinone hydroxylase family protein [Sphingomonas sp. UMB7805-LC452B]NUU47032.1 demethoxyubiquinone hydroxylase family protein [Sphingomonas zeae]